MITKVKLQYFKRFPDETFILDNTIVLAGPNNSGKTTLLQAISAWNLALQRWFAEHPDSSTASQRTGVPISRQDFTAIPLREMNLLWSDRATAFSKEEKPGIKPGTPKPAAISIYGKEPDNKEWDLTVTLRYANKELVYIKLTDAELNPRVDVPPPLKELKIVHVPPFSGIGAEETGLQPGYQNRLVGQGKPGDILRNLLLEVFNTRYWQTLTDDVKELFDYELLEPTYQESTDPFIRVEYRDPGSKTRKPLDIASAGSGFHQVLTLLGFFYAREASILLLDEPDAHQHVILQRQVYDRLREAARKRNCQLIVSTHSEIIIEDTAPEQILSFYGYPHRLDVDTQRNQVREALKRLLSLDILAAESKRNILYVEDESDFKILREFARILNHKMKAFFDDPFYYAIHGRDVREARAHLFGLKSVRSDIKGVLLLDGDNRGLPDHEISADHLTVLRWQRYEIENYLFYPESIYRFVDSPEQNLFSKYRKDKAKKYLQRHLAPGALEDPFGDDSYLMSVPHSKKLLPDMLEESEVKLAKKDYYLIAAQMEKEEIHPEVIEKLDKMAEVLVSE
jgi:predicted ATPase